MEASLYNVNQVRKFPDKPGIYKFNNSEGVLIYVGKAKNLKKRVTSYFNKNLTVNRKTRRMVSEIKSIEFTIVNSEFDALLLENNLIKTSQPKYNILLKDDKSFPFVCITKERFPRIHSTRRVNHQYAEYFGPYANVKALNSVLALIHNVYQIRTCKYNLSEENITKGKFNVCLEYHIGNCQGPCANLQSEANYNDDIDQAKQLLIGGTSKVKSNFKRKMNEASSALQFELAQSYKDKIKLLEKFQAKTLIVNPKIHEVDVITILSDDKLAFINALQIKKGTIVATKTIEVKKKLNETDEAIISLIALILRDDFQSQAREIISNIAIDLPGIKNIIPQRGDKLKLLELSKKNALFYKKEKYVVHSIKEPKESRVLNELKNQLQLKTLPNHIECFDNSNLQGTNPVASMVCFINARPSKKNYRHYNIKTVDGPDDFASMYEITHRRYSRLLNESLPLPDLIVVDGGKGQLSAACNALKDIGIYGRVPIVGIAKRLEEIYLPNDAYPLHINKKSEALKLIQQIRDEAHRFAITFHRLKRSQATFKTELEEIKGIGKSTLDILFKKYKSSKKIKEAPLEELAILVGQHKASLIKA